MARVREIEQCDWETRVNEWYRHGAAIETAQSHIGAELLSRITRRMADDGVEPQHVTTGYMEHVLAAVDPFTARAPDAWRLSQVSEPGEACALFRLDHSVREAGPIWENSYDLMHITYSQ